MPRMTAFLFPADQTDRDVELDDRQMRARTSVRNRVGRKEHSACHSEDEGKSQTHKHCMQ